jgi:hypothetical protein
VQSLYFILLSTILLNLSISPLICRTIYCSPHTVRLHRCLHFLVVMFLFLPIPESYCLRRLPLRKQSELLLLVFRMHTVPHMNPPSLDYLVISINHSHFFFWFMVLECSILRRVPCHLDRNLLDFVFELATGHVWALAKRHDLSILESGRDEKRWFQDR